MNNTIQVLTNTPKNQNLANLGVGGSYSDIIFIKHLYLSGVWLGVSTDIKKAGVLKEIGLHAQKLLTILGSIVNIIGKTFKIIR